MTKFKINMNKLKLDFLKEHNIDLSVIKSDLKKIKSFLKSINYVNYPNRVQLLKNKQTNRLYLTITAIDFSIVILAYSDKQTLEEQMLDLFPEFNFFEQNSAGGFNLFPGNKYTIYGFSDEQYIYLGDSSNILEF